ncbi:MAG: WYL domain-containing protein [Candidatus Latescibacterota bacterium]
MGGHILIDRYHWLDAEIRAGRCPNARQLALHFEISEKTARRTIAYLRDMLGAPLEYDRHRKGFRYSETSFQLPPLRVSQEEILALLVARRLLDGCAGGCLGRALGSCGSKLLTASDRAGLSPVAVEARFSASFAGCSPAEAEIFRIVAAACLADRCLTFTYRSPLTGLDDIRTVEPHHLQHYQGSWLLIAWCRRRGDWRKFALARMTAPRPEPETFTPRPRSAFAHLLDHAYGLFGGREAIPVQLLFAPFRARWIKEQVWHPDQEMEERPDGSLVLTVPVTDFREIKLAILRYGAEVEVIAPAALRQEVKAEVERMAVLYGVARGTAAG